MTERTGSLRDILTVLFKHKRKIITTFLIVFFIGVLITLVTSRVYEATSSLLVKFGRENFYTPEVGEGRPQQNAMGPEELLNSEVAILNNQESIGEVITTLGTTTLYPDLHAHSGIAARDAAIARFQKDLVAFPVKKSNVIYAAFRHHDPVLSAKALNLLIDRFRARHLQIFADPKSAFLEAQLAVFTTRLKDAETALETFKQQHKIFALDDQRGGLLAQRTTALNADRDAENRLTELTHKIASLTSQMASVKKDAPLTWEKERSRSADDAQGQLLTLRMKEQELLAKYTPENRLVVNLRKEIALLESYLTQQETRSSQRVINGRNGLYAEMERDLIMARAEIESQKARRASLAVQITAIDNDLKGLDEQSTRFQTLRRELATAERNYQTYLDRTTEARIADTMNRQKMASVTIIHPATIPAAPVKPLVGYNLLLALIIGSVSGLGLAFISEYAGQSLSTPEHAERRLLLPVLASVGHKG